MADKKSSSVGQIVMYILLFALVAAALVLGVRISNLNSRLEVESIVTPTPAYSGNMQQVTPDPSAPTRAPLLKTGSIGQQVVQLQNRLIELGYLTGDADGQFGPATENAVILFQQQNGLDADGKVGPSTSALLYSDQARRFTATPTPAAAFFACSFSSLAFSSAKRFCSSAKALSFLILSL